MSIPNLDPEGLKFFTDRIRQITSESTRQWGTMSAAQMLIHLNLSVKGSLGEIPLKDRSNFLLRLARPIVFSGYIPMPKGKAKTAPEYEVQDDSDVEIEMPLLLDTLDRFIHMCELSPDDKPLHPLFGPMTIPQWQKGHALHFEHHLRQFNV